MATETEQQGDTPLTIRLHDSGGNPVMAEIVAVDRETSGVLVVIFHVTLEVWNHINTEELFNTQRNRRVGDIEGRFEPDRPIAIEAKLDDLVVQSLQLVDASASDLLARLASIQPNTLDEFLLSARSWHARSVTQIVPLPPELEGMGSVSAGFRIESRD